MAVSELDARRGGDRDRFIELERELAGHNALFVSEPDDDVDARLRGDSPSFDETELALFVAEGGDRDVARCAAIINRRWQRSEREPSAGFDTRHVGFIGYFAAAPQQRDAVIEMLARAEDWLRSRCIRRVIAPSNGNALIGMGVLTDAFNESPMFPMPWHPSYYRDYLERAGYAPRYPIWFYDIDFGTDAYRRWRAEVEAQAKALARRRGSPRFSVRPVRRGTKREWDEDVETLRKLFNEGFRGEWEVQEHTAAEFREFYPDFLRDPKVLPEDFMLFGMLDEEPIGLCISFPDWTPLFRSFRGKVTGAPIEDQIKEFNARFGITRAGVMGAALRPGRLGARFGSQLVLDAFRRMEDEHRLPGVLGYWINHSNPVSRGFCVDAGGRGRILYHCYDKIFC